MTAVARAGVALGDVQRILVESKVIAPHHAREIRSALNDVITECRIAKESLQPLAAHRDMTKYAPLFSLKNLPGEEKNRPPRSWWKFWKRIDAKYRPPSGGLFSYALFFELFKI